MIYDSLTSAVVRLDQACRSVDSRICNLYFLRECFHVSNMLRKCRRDKLTGSNLGRPFPESVDYEVERLLFHFGVLLIVAQYVDTAKLNAYEKNDFRQLVSLVKESCGEDRYNSDFKKDVDDFLSKLC